MSTVEGHGGGIPVIGPILRFVIWYWLVCGLVLSPVYFVSEFANCRSHKCGFWFSLFQAFGRVPLVFAVGPLLFGYVVYSAGAWLWRKMRDNAP
jgi:hypothetical protein